MQLSTEQFEVAADTPPLKYVTLKTTLSGQRINVVLANESIAEIESMDPTADCKNVLKSIFGYLDKREAPLYFTKAEEFALRKIVLESDESRNTWITPDMRTSVSTWLENWTRDLQSLKPMAKEAHDTLQTHMHVVMTVAKEKADRFMFETVFQKDPAVLRLYSNLAVALLSMEPSEITKESHVIERLLYGILQRSLQYCGSPDAVPEFRLKHFRRRVQYIVKALENELEYAKE